MKRCWSPRRVSSYCSDCLLQRRFLVRQLVSVAVLSKGRFTFNYNYDTQCCYNNLKWNGHFTILYQFRQTRFHRWTRSSGSFHAQQDSLNIWKFGFFMHACAAEPAQGQLIPFKSMIICQLVCKLYITMLNNIFGVQHDTLQEVFEVCEGDVAKILRISNVCFGLFFTDIAGQLDGLKKRHPSPGARSDDCILYCIFQQWCQGIRKFRMVSKVPMSSM